MESFLESVGSTLTDMTACAQSALEHLSWYLADHTGFDADTCYNAVPAFAAYRPLRPLPVPGLVAQPPDELRAGAAAGPLARPGVLGRPLVSR